jgi:coenzyme F420-reducing hydrogenase beta subunit
MVETINKVVAERKCMGCMACAQVCPKEAIIFSLNNFGFFEPKINNNECVRCGLCFKKCVSINEINREKPFLIKYGWSNNPATRAKSSSGGAFYEIAKQFIKNGGVVYGARLFGSDNLSHIRVDNINDLELLQGSKYIQSNIGSCLKQILVDIKSGIRVLFCGTPCQVASVRTIIQSDLLFTIDLVCFGFVSNGAFKIFTKALERKYNSNTKNIIFRDSKNNNRMNVTFENGQSYYCDYRGNPKTGFYALLHSRAGIKNVCTDCKFASTERLGDITLSDYPYMEANEIDPNKMGVSVIYVNSKRSEELIKNLNMSLWDSKVNFLEKFTRSYSSEKFYKKVRSFENNYSSFENDNTSLLRYCDKINKEGLFSKIKNKLWRFKK